MRAVSDLAIRVREWHGTPHHVTIVDDGFVWNGSTHRSLSSIARAITGTNWNGPRFFGTREIGHQHDLPVGDAPDHSANITPPVKHSRARGRQPTILGLPQGQTVSPAVQTVG